MQASTLLFATSRRTSPVFCGVIPLPSLLVRALTPQQLFGSKEDTGPVPRSPAGSASGDNALRSGEGRWLQHPPVRRLCHTFQTQGGAAARGAAPMLVSSGEQGTFTGSTGYGCAGRDRPAPPSACR